MRTVEEQLARINALAIEVEAAANELDAYIGSQEFAGASNAQAAIVFYQAKQGHSKLDEARKGIYHVVDRLDKVVMPERLAEDDAENTLKVPAIKRSFYRLRHSSASIIDKPKGHEWLRANGLSEIILETVNAQTLAKALDEFVVDNGRDPPEEIFKKGIYYTTGSSAYNPK